MNKIRQFQICSNKHETPLVGQELPRTAFIVLLYLLIYTSPTRMSWAGVNPHNIYCSTIPFDIYQSN